MRIFSFKADRTELSADNKAGTLQPPHASLESSNISTKVDHQQSLSCKFFILLLVFRRKDLCEAKHDVVCVRNFAQNWTIWGGG